MTNKEIANTILGQLGGSKISVMIRVKKFSSISNGLQIRWTAKSKNKSNMVTITLNYNDLYDVKFLSLRGVSFTERSSHNDIYAEDLISLFETETGLFLHF